MIRVHHLNNSHSQRMLWLLEELGRPYEVIRYERVPATMAAPPELKAIHPLGKSPIVEVDGQVLVESGAIVEMLAKGSALVPPEGSGAHASYLHILHFAEGSAGALGFPRPHPCPPGLPARPGARRILRVRLLISSRPANCPARAVCRGRQFMAFDAIGT